MSTDKTVCPVCNAGCSLLEPVDFNKSCEPNSLGVSGIPITYALCQGCGFCFAPEMYRWDLETFEQKIYNDQYVKVDPEYIQVRPGKNARILQGTFGTLASSLKHLDYGGGNGSLCRLLQATGWKSTSYDPFVDKNLSVETLGKFDLITAFEVFEHVPDVWKLMSDLKNLVAADGVIVFSTLLSDGHIQAGQALTWWYAAPRNGHISLFSAASLAILAQSQGFGCGSFSEGVHAFCTQIPPWAARAFGQPDVAELR